MLQPVRAFAIAVVLTLVTNAMGFAQGSSATIRGVVTGPDGRPMANQDVVLHRVAGAGGGNLASAKSDKDGNFAITVANPDASMDAVYFLAARYNDEMYLGDAFKAPFDTTIVRTVQVGVAATSARALVAGATAEQSQVLPQAPQPEDPTRWLIIVMPALAALALVVMLFASRGRIPARRRLLLEVAQLDEQSSDADNYAERRAALIDRLNTPAEV